MILRPYFSLLSVFLVLFPVTTLATKADKAWFSCETKSDCDIAFNYCGQPEGVNRTFTKQAQDYFHKIPYHCRAFQVPKKGDPGWDAWLERVRAGMLCKEQRCFIPEELRFETIEKKDLIDLLRSKP